MAQIADPDFYDGMPAVKATANGMSREVLNARARSFLVANGADSIVLDALFGEPGFARHRGVGARMVSAETKERARVMFRGGLTRREVADALGQNYKAVCEWVKGVLV